MSHWLEHVDTVGVRGAEKALRRPIEAAEFLAMFAGVKELVAAGVLVSTVGEE